MSLAIHSLQALFRKGINYRTYPELLAATKCKTIGNLPKDVMSVVISGAPAAERGELITSVSDSYKRAVKMLKEVEKSEIQAINRAPASDRQLRRFQESAIAALKERKNISVNDMYGYEDAVFIERQTEHLICAEQELFDGYKKIMPDLKNIVLSSIGEGELGRAYKVEFIFANGERKINPQVIKVFRDKWLTNDSVRLINRMYNNASDAVMADLFKCTGPEVATVKKAVCKSFQKMLETINKEGGCTHGAVAEANITEYLRHMYGHKLAPKDGIVLPDYYFLGENPFAISRYVGKAESAKRKFDFGRLGLACEDAEINAANGINGICIDVGGTHPMTPVRISTEGPCPVSLQRSSIVGSKIGTKISKELSKLKTKEEKAKYLEELIDNSSGIKNNTQRRETLDAAEEILGTRMNEIC